ncbi:MAG: substrate-binding domain-containing protein [Isosphaeraceae bacterium]
MTLNDLFLFRDLYRQRRRGRHVREIAEELKISEKKCRELFAAIEEEVRPDGSAHGFIEASLRTENTEAHRALAAFHTGLCGVLDELTHLVNDCRRGQQRVVIQGSEYSILCMLPRILEKSQFLTKHPAVILDIRRAYWPRFVVNLQKGRIDLALGPKARVRSNIEMVRLFSSRRTLIYHKDHKFALNKQPFELDVPADLRRETLFLYPGQISWGYTIHDKLPPPEEGGRRIYVDSVTHMYEYVQRDLGVAIGFELRHAPFHGNDKIQTHEIPENILAPAEFYLYFRKDRIGKTTRAADLLRDTIVEVAPTLGH